MILYTLVGMIIIYLLFIVFIKVRFNFWSKQPVFHLYNLYYWLWPCGVIQRELPPITKFYNRKILTNKFKDVSAEKKELFYTLIKSHFLNGRKEIYNPPKFAVLEYFKGHNKNSHLSLQFEKLPMTNKGFLSQKSSNKVISAMSSRPLTATFNNKEVLVNYVDFLCVHKKYRKGGLAQQIIYSHYYNARNDNAGPVFLFKREGVINFIVPLTVYTAHVFPLKYLKHPNLDLPNNIVCHLISDSNFSMFTHFFGEIKSKFKCCITPDQSHIKHLVSKKMLFICLIMEGQTPVGVYIYRTPFTKYDGKQSIECIASYYKLGYYDIFIKSFRNTIVLINQKYQIDILIMENISNNNDIINHLLKKSTVLWKCPMAYFLYNFAYKPFFSADVFLIN